MHGVDNRKQGWVPVFQLEQGAPSPATRFEYQLLVTLRLRVPVELGKSPDVLYILLRPLAGVDIIHIVDVQLAASAEVMRVGRSRISDQLMSAQKVADDWNEHAFANPPILAVMRSAEANSWPPKFLELADNKLDIVVDFVVRWFVRPRNNPCQVHVLW